MLCQYKISKVMQFLLIICISVTWLKRYDKINVDGFSLHGPGNNNIRRCGGLTVSSKIKRTATTNTKLCMARKLSREDEIRRKIMELKREGRIGGGSNKKDNDKKESLESLQERTRDLMKNKNVESMYGDKIKTKLGGNKKVAAASKFMGRSISGVSTLDAGSSERTASSKEGKGLVDDDDEDDEGGDAKEKELVDLVSLKLAQKKMMEKQSEKGISINRGSNGDTKTNATLIGEENKNITKFKSETYRPSRGSWGYFERPKSISKEFGGGKRVGAGVAVDEAARLKAEEETKERLRRYREKAGIDVASEKENAQVIEEAIKLASLANQRGMYATTVSSLEKVTKYCSTNSKVGGKVFLELAMAYEAVGRTSEAITVYSALSKSPIERIKMNAQKLLYGLEAMNFMRNEVKSEAFSRSKIRNNFIDTTGLANIADNFDVVYNTAYVDLDKGGNYYKRLTESLVRSSREARQILLKALSADEVPRLKVVQALRSISNSFDDALMEEMKQLKEEELESVAYINGVPIKKPASETSSSSSSFSGNDIRALDKYNLASPSQMIMNLNGEWRLQLIADQKGDGVKFFNTTLSWQSFQTNIDDDSDDDIIYINNTDLQYAFYGPSGFSTLSKQGYISFNNEKRILTHDDKPSLTSTQSYNQQNQNPFSIISNALFTPSNQKLETKQMLQPQQIILVDSVLCVTRLVPEKFKADENIKNYFSVWRKVSQGTYSDSSE